MPGCQQTSSLSHLYTCTIQLQLCLQMLAA